MPEISKRIKKLIKEIGKDQQQVAKDLGLVPSTFAEYANGNRKPNTDTLKAMAKYFNVSVDYLVGNSEEERPVKIALGHLSEEQMEFIKNPENKIYLELAMDIKSKTKNEKS